MSDIHDKANCDETVLDTEARLRSQLAAAQDSANTWHTRAEAHRQAAENAEKRLAEAEELYKDRARRHEADQIQMTTADALLREARDMIDRNMNHYINRPPNALVKRIDAHLSRKEGET